MNLQRELSRYKETLKCCAASIWAEKNANGYIVVGIDNPQCPSCCLKAYLCTRIQGAIEHELDPVKNIGEAMVEAHRAIRRG